MSFCFCFGKNEPLIKDEPKRIDVQGSGSNYRRIPIMDKPETKQENNQFENEQNQAKERHDSDFPSRFQEK